MFCGGRIAVGRGASAMGATVDEGWLAVALFKLGEPSSCFTSVLGAGFVFGFVMGMADRVTVLEAMALARAR